jgi:hypothetical protein
MMRGKNGILNGFLYNYFMVSYTRSTGRLFPLPALALSFVFFLLGLMAVIQGFFPAMFLLLAGFTGLFLKGGFELDIENMEYRQYWGVPGMKFGKWKKLPQPDKLTITTSVESYSNNLVMGGAQTTSSSISSNLNIKINERKRIVASSGKYGMVMEDACTLAALLQLDILDCSQKKRKLIKYEEMTV